MKHRSLEDLGAVQWEKAPNFISYLNQLIKSRKFSCTLSTCEEVNGDKQKDLGKVKGTPLKGRMTAKTYHLIGQLNWDR